MSMSHLGSTRDAEKDVSDGVGLSHESPCAAVDQEQQHDVDAKLHDDEAKNKIFVARNGSMGVPNGKKGALSAKDCCVSEHDPFFRAHSNVTIMCMQARSCPHRCMCILPSLEHPFLRYQQHLLGLAGLLGLF